MGKQQTRANTVGEYRLVYIYSLLVEFKVAITPCTAYLQYLQINIESSAF